MKIVSVLMMYCSLSGGEIDNCSDTMKECIDFNPNICTPCYEVDGVTYCGEVQSHD